MIRKKNKARFGIPLHLTTSSDSAGPGIAPGKKKNKKNGVERKEKETW